MLIHKSFFDFVYLSGFLLLATLFVPTSVHAQTSTRQGTDGNGSITIEGEQKQWHKVTLTLDGKFAHERDTSPNPFVDYSFTVTFKHESGSPVYKVPGYFAADGNAAETSAESGTKWRAHLSPDKAGRWNYVAVLKRTDTMPLTKEDYHLQKTGEFEVLPTDKSGRDLRGKGRLQYVGQRYLKFAGSGDYFLKAGADAPETLLAFKDFDGTRANKSGVPLKTFSAHVKDFKDGDPSWKNGKGKGLIGAINYLSGKGCNVFSFLPYNAGGDGDNVWPFVDRDEKFHYDCSKLDQWGIVFDHGTEKGMYLHFKLQETEIDDNRPALGNRTKDIPTSLDNGALGPERKLYCREMIARFGHNLALNWNLGEENTQTPEEQRAMAAFIAETDPYDHNIVIHTYPDQQDKVYPKLLGDQSVLTGASLQNSWRDAHKKTKQWIKASAAANRPWVCCNDEQGPAGLGVPPDPGYQGFSGTAKDKKKPNSKGYTIDDIRKQALWGTLMAGGAGVEYYFGYQLAENDLKCEDFRSRDQSWDYCRVALEFFKEEKIPFPTMDTSDELLSDTKGPAYCFAKKGEIYLVYLANNQKTTLELAAGKYSMSWFNPRTGGSLEKETQVTGGNKIDLKSPFEGSDDWLAVIRAE